MPKFPVNLKKQIIYFIRDSISFVIYCFISWKKRSVVTLVYHSVDRVDEAKDTYRLNIAPERFEQHLKVISKFKDDIEITFDDGYGNNYQYAFPLLRKYGLTATIFLITDFIDDKIRSQVFCGEGLELRPLTWEEIKTIDDLGIKFGSHTKTHPVLAKISGDKIWQELVDSKKRIESEIGHTVDSLAYPFGGRDSFSTAVAEDAKESGYKCAYTNIMGVNADRTKDNYRLKRVRIYSEDGPLKLKMKLSGAYDWVDK